MRKVRKAVITAAGRGTRHYPATSAVQKEMFPLVDRDGLTKPLIQLVVEEAVESGAEEVCIVTQPGDERIYRDYFRRLDGNAIAPFRDRDWALREGEKLESLGQRLHFVEQRTPEGFGHAVYQAKRFVGDEPFVLLLGDHVFISDTPARCARQAIDVFEEYDLDVLTAVQLTTERELHLFGTIRGRPVDPVRGVYQSELIIEKPSIDVARDRLVTPGLPAGHYLSHFGIHVFGPIIFDALEHLISNGQREQGEFQLTAAQEIARQRSERSWVAIVRGHRCDAGIPVGLVETQLALAMRGVHRDEIERAIARLRRSDR